MSKHTATEVPCPACEGSGRVPLDGRSQAVYDLIAKGRRRWTAADVLTALGHDDVHVTAINNRLEKMRTAGLLSRERKGRRMYYFKM